MLKMYLIKTLLRAMGIPERWLLVLYVEASLLEKVLSLCHLLDRLSRLFAFLSTFPFNFSIKLYWLFMIRERRFTHFSRGGSNYLATGLRKLFAITKLQFNPIHTDFCFNVSFYMDWEQGLKSHKFLLRHLRDNSSWFRSETPAIQNIMDENWI